MVKTLLGQVKQYKKRFPAVPFRGPRGCDGGADPIYHGNDHRPWVRGKEYQ